MNQERELSRQGSFLRAACATLLWVAALYVLIFGVLNIPGLVELALSPATMSWQSVGGALHWQELSLIPAVMFALFARYMENVVSKAERMQPDEAKMTA